MKRDRLKMIFTIILTLIFILIFTFIIVVQNFIMLSQSNEKQDAMKLDAMDRTLTNLEAAYEKAENDLSSQFEVNALLSAKAFEHVIAREGDNAIGLYGTSAVIRVDGNKITAPNHIDSRLSLLPGMFEKSHDVFPGMLDPDILITFSRIGNTHYYYVDWEHELNLYDVTTKMVNLDENLRSAESAYNGNILLLMHNSYLDPDELFVIYSSPPFTGVETLSDLGLDPEQLQSKGLSITEYDSATYQCALRAYDSDSVYMLFMMPIADTMNMAISQSVFMSCVMTILLLSFVVGIFSLYRFVREYSLPPVLEKRYRPTRIRKFALLYGLIGIMVLTATGAFIYSLNGLFMTAQKSSEALDILDDRISLVEKEGDLRSVDAEKIYIGYARHIARLLDRYPAMRTETVLNEIKGMINATSITIYDRTGREEISSDGFINLSLGTEKSSPTYDFRRLLKGVPSIIHDVAVDELLGTEQIQVGASIRDFEDPDAYGAIIISIDPAVAQPVIAEDISTIMKYMSSDGSRFFEADRETGTVLAAGDEDLIGSNISSLGLNEESLHGDIMNYVKSTHGSFFVVSKEKDDSILYYTLDLSNINDGRTSFLLTLCILFLLMYAALSLVMLRKYNDRFYEENKLVGGAVLTGENEVITPSGIKKYSIDPSARWSSIRAMWKNMLPEKKGLLVAQVLAAILIISLFVSSFFEGDSKNVKSLYYYITAGSWDRGYNMFAAASIILLGCELFLAVAAARLILQILSILLGTKGETICRLIVNLIEYGAVIAFVFFSLSYLGFDTRALLASVGLLTLAVSLGAKDLVADILAGITIVFEGEFQVGDIIEVGGYRGTVMEIGVRSTKVLGQGGNIKIIGNQDVKGVINMTQLNSWYPCEITISSEISIEELEQMLSRELPRIGDKIPAIVSGPTYKGVTQLGKGTMTISILTECKEADYHKVQRSVNRELQSLFKSNGISI